MAELEMYEYRYIDTSTYFNKLFPNLNKFIYSNTSNTTSFYKCSRQKYWYNTISSRQYDIDIWKNISIN